MGIKFAHIPLGGGSIFFVPVFMGVYCDKCGSAKSSLI
jgi:hypothetical protein